MQDRCQAITESYRRRERCTRNAVGAFERTRKAFKDEPAWPGTVTEPLGRLCRRHANQFGAQEVQR